MALAPSGGLPVDSLRQREQQGAVGVGANRITKAFVRPVECADAIVFAIAKCRLAPNVDAKFTVSGALAFSYMNWAASPSSAGAVRPPAEMLAGNVNNTKQRLLGYVVALHHETDYRFVYHFVKRRLGATLSVTPHVSSAIFEV